MLQLKVVGIKQVFIIFFILYKLTHAFTVAYLIDGESFRVEIIVDTWSVFWNFKKFS